MSEMLRDVELWAKLRESSPEHFSHFDKLYRQAVARLASARYERHHMRRPGGLRAHAKARRERAAAGYCPHGVYVGGCGADYMCGACESGEGSTLSKSERVRLNREG